MSSPVDVTFFEGFLVDGRKSMRLYGEHLSAALSHSFPQRFRVRSYTPLLPSGRLNSKIRLRYGRYVSYPRQARHNQGSVNHILDQTYAHLLRTVDPARTVVTVHDVTPLVAWKRLIPGLTYPHYPLLFKHAIRSLVNARAVIAVSENTKRDLVAHCGIDETKITVIHNGIDPCFRSLTRNERDVRRAALELPDRRTYVLLIVGNQAYKNHRTSIHAASIVERMLDRPVQLVWLGGSPAQGAAILREHPLRNPILYLEELTQDQLVDLYNSIDCLLFPSWYEGFGWPPLEAMACGTPVVTSNAASLREIVGDAAPMAAPGDSEGLASAVASVWNDDALRSDFINRGLANTRRFTWEQCAASVADIYERLIDERCEKC